MGIRRACAALLAGLLLGTGAARAAEPAYDYPFVDGLEATVLGTPPAYRAELPDEVPTEEIRLEVFPKRVPPAIFWYADRLPIAVVRQQGPAPLVFLVAGTGSGHSGSSMRELVKAFYKGGFHVVSIASPTHPSFMVAASESQVPGMPESDARDLYRVMRLAHERIADTIDITGVHLVGYSLGAAEAAYVAKLDDAERRLGFGRVLLINPPVSLYRTAEKLDGMIFAIPGGVDGFDKFFYEHFVQFATVYRQSDTLDFTDDFLYALYKQNPPEQRTFEALIGISFRMAAANMLFTADVLTHAGVVVPKERVLASTDSLTVYAKTCAYLGFRTYMDDLLLPALQRLRPEMTIDDLIAESGLAPLGDYLAATPRIGLMHNVDDPILTEGDLDFLRRTFAGRARIYLKGGHLGNLNHHRNVADMLAFLRGEWGGS